MKWWGQRKTLLLLCNSRLEWKVSQQPAVFPDWAAQQIGCRGQIGQKDRRRILQVQVMLVLCGYSSSNHSGKIAVNQSWLKKKKCLQTLPNFDLRFVFMSEEMKSHTSVDVSSLERVALQQLGLMLTSSLSIVHVWNQVESLVGAFKTRKGVCRLKVFYAILNYSLVLNKFKITVMFRLY